MKSSAKQQSGPCIPSPTHGLLLSPMCFLPRPELCHEWGFLADSHSGLAFISVPWIRGQEPEIHLILPTWNETANYKNNYQINPGV